MRFEHQVTTTYEVDVDAMVGEFTDEAMGFGDILDTEGDGFDSLAFVRDVWDNHTEAEFAALDSVGWSAVEDSALEVVS